AAACMRAWASVFEKTTQCPCGQRALIALARPFGSESQMFSAFAVWTASQISSWPLRQGPPFAAGYPSNAIWAAAGPHQTIASSAWGWKVVNVETCAAAGSDARPASKAASRSGRNAVRYWLFIVISPCDRCSGAGNAGVVERHGLVVAAREDVAVAVDRPLPAGEEEGMGAVAARRPARRRHHGVGDAEPGCGRAGDGRKDRRRLVVSPIRGHRIAQHVAVGIARRDQEIEGVGHRRRDDVARFDHRGRAMAADLLERDLRRSVVDQQAQAVAAR